MGNSFNSFDFYNDPNSNNPFGLRNSGRKLNTDGTVNIICRICEKIISREPYRRFSTATCAVCHGEIERGKTPQEILAAIHAAEDKSTRDMLDDIGPGNFKVSGIGVRIRQFIEDIVKPAAAKRRRGTLLSKKDNI